MPSIRLVNPARKAKTLRGRGSSARRTKVNPGPGGWLISMANSSKKKPRSAAQKAATRRMLAARTDNPSAKVITRYKNGAGKGKKPRKRNGMHRTRNPFSVAGFNLKQLAEGGVGAAGGAIATRAITERFFSGHNEGLTGYALNLSVAVGLGYAAFRFLKLPTLATGIVFGGVGSTMQRVYSENISKLVPAAMIAATGGESTGRGMGDAEYSHAGTYVLNGYYQATYPEGVQLGERIGAPEPLPALLPQRRRNLDHMAV